MSYSGNRKVKGANMTVKDIVKKHLEDNGYDGLFLEESCGCILSDFMPCDNPSQECVPGYKVPCDCFDWCEWHIGPKKEVTDET